MPPLPTGTVTLLFTDVEGSTELLKRLGAEYVGGARRPAPDARASNRVVRRCDGRHTGRLVPGGVHAWPGCGRRGGRSAARAGSAPMAGRGDAARAHGPPHGGADGGARTVRRSHGASRGADHGAGSRRPGAPVALDGRRRRGWRGPGGGVTRSRRAPPQGHRPAGARLPTRRRRPRARLSAVADGCVRATAQPRETCSGLLHRSAAGCSGCRGARADAYRGERLRHGDRELTRRDRHRER